MHRTMIGILCFGVSGLALAQVDAQVPPPPAKESMKIVCDGKVKSNGEATFTFTPAGGIAKDVHITLAKGMNENDVCRDVAKELAVLLGPGYKVDRYDEDKVKVEAKEASAFSLVIGGQTATGITIELKQG
jgi:hypothetical protein